MDTTMDIHSLDFQDIVLALLVVDREAMLWAQDYLSPDFFDNHSNRIIWKYLMKYFTTYGEVPSWVVFDDYLENSMHPLEKSSLKALDIKEKVKKIWMLSEQGTGLDYAKDRLSSFVQARARLKAMNDSLTLIQQGRFDQADEIWRRAALVGKENRFADGVWFLELEDGYSEIECDEKIPTLIRGLDDKNVLNGGLARGELGIVIAPPKGGKSTFLIVVARGAVWTGHKVLYCSLEMSEWRLVERFGRAFGLKKEEGSWAEQIKWIKMFGGSMLIKKFPTNAVNVMGLKAYLSYLRLKHNWSPDVIVVDYGEIMASSRKRDEDWIDIGDKYCDLRYLAETEQCVVWTALQSNRGSFNKEIINKEDVGRSIEPLKIADFCVAICQTKDEREKDKARLFVICNRNNQQGQEIECALDFKEVRIR